MVPDPSTSSTDSAISEGSTDATDDSVGERGTDVAESSILDGSSSTLVNALIGAVAGIVLSFVPLSTVLGGGVAGYLEGTRTEDGLRAGAIAGAVMLVPFALFGLAFLSIFLGVGAPIAFGLLGLVVLIVSALYTVGLGALGGYLGSYVRDELNE